MFSRGINAALLLKRDLAACGLQDIWHNRNFYQPLVLRMPYVFQVCLYMGSRIPSVVHWFQGS